MSYGLKNEVVAFSGWLPSLGNWHLWFPAALHIFLWLEAHFFLLLRVMVHWIGVPQFVSPLPVEGKLGCLQFGAIINKVALSIYAQAFLFVCGYKFSAHLGKYLGAHCWVA